MGASIEPTFKVDLDGYRFLGRGPTATGSRSGWLRSRLICYRCVVCGDSMSAAQKDYFTCRCGAMHLDADAGRFGSNQGDSNILVYRASKFTAYDLWPQVSYRVIKEFVDYDKLLHPIGERWKFLQESFLPYEDGLSLMVERDGKPCTIRLQCRDDQQNAIVQVFSEYVAELEDPLPPRIAR